MNKKQKKMLTRIIIAAVLMIAFKVISTFVDIPTVVLFIMYMVPYLVIGYDILRKAIKGILNRQVFDENFLMAVATVGAIIIALVDDGEMCFPIVEGEQQLRFMDKWDYIRTIGEPDAWGGRYL
jgi:Cd2+/Zn2+-exporting ATPase